MASFLAELKRRNVFKISVIWGARNWEPFY